MDGESEIQSFIKAWLLAISSLFYCYFVASRIPVGLTRFLSLLPIIYLFTILPLKLSSFYLCAATVFYLVWLANFKLLLFSFNQGPLSSSSSSSTHPPLSLLQFISVGLLPIKSKTVPSSTSRNNGKPHDELSPFVDAAVFATKLGFLVGIIWMYNYREHLHQTVILALYCCHVYLGAELTLAITAAPVRVILGLEIEPQFNEPYLATSLQDFWGRRWNLMVTSILRPTVYTPIRCIYKPILGHNWSMAVAIVATFLVSGLMHELLYHYLSRASPTWEVTWFFILHGFCVAIEIGVKKALKNCRWRLHRAVYGPITIGFVAVTAAWLFFPQVLRHGLDLKAINEYYIVLRFVKERLGIWM